MTDRLHLVRHGEVENPAGVVYADLPGYPLSALGRRQAVAAGKHLAALGEVAAVWSSPLDRAVETAALIGQQLGIEPAVDPRLTEWGLARRWAGVPWHELSTRFPGEVEAYGNRPDQLEFSPESIQAVAARMAAAVEDLIAASRGGSVVVVSHQDPIQAARFRLLGRPLSGLMVDKPGHATVLTLDRAGEGWSETGSWAPDLGGRSFPP